MARPAGARCRKDGARHSARTCRSSRQSAAGWTIGTGFRILDDRISREPLAQLVREEDVDLFNVLRWTVFAMIDAEALGVTSANLPEMASRDDPDIARCSA
jgi:hypothetical protein